MGERINMAGTKIETKVTTPTITCPRCDREMRKIHNYINVEFMKLVVWYCPPCDYALTLPNKITSVVWKRV